MLHVENFINHLKQLSEDIFQKKYLLTVSGGRDSCVLAYLFHQLNLNFDIAHCNFHLRGEESNLDMEFVKNIPFFSDKKIFIKEFDTYKLKENSKKSIEMLARELRYEWFHELAKDYDYIVTAHHANDNAETVLINLTRGTGLKGLTGISAVNGKIIRPLLPYTIAEIERFAKENKIQFRTDKSNFSSQYQRNKIRHAVIPLLQEMNPALIDTFSRNSDILKKQYDFFADTISTIKKRILEEKNNKFYITIAELIKEKHSELILYELLADFDFNESTVKNIYESLHTQSGSYFYSENYKLLKARNQLIISNQNEQIEKNIEIDNIDKLQQLGFEIKLFENNQKITFSDDKNVIYVDKNKLTFPLIIRNWENCDYFYPYGILGRKKLSDFFIDKKIERDQKGEILILLSDNKIVWIVGYGADRRFSVEKNRTKQYYKISISSKFHS